MTVFPPFLTHDAAEYYSTGKLGRNIATGHEAAEYEAVDTPGDRVWLLSDGTILED